MCTLHFSISKVLIQSVLSPTCLGAGHHHHHRGIHVVRVRTDCVRTAELLSVCCILLETFGQLNTMRIINNSVKFAKSHFVKHYNDAIFLLLYH